MGERVKRLSDDVTFMDVLEVVYRGVVELRHVLSITGCGKVVSGNMISDFRGMNTTEERVVAVTVITDSAIPEISRLVMMAVRSGGGSRHRWGRTGSYGSGR